LAAWRNPLPVALAGSTARSACATANARDTFTTVRDLCAAKVMPVTSDPDWPSRITELRSVPRIVIRGWVFPTVTASW
jgi:hypothetical protein